MVSRLLRNCLLLICKKGAAERFFYGVLVSKDKEEGAGAFSKRFLKCRSSTLQKLPLQAPPIRCHEVRPDQAPFHPLELITYAVVKKACPNAALFWMPSQCRGS